MLRTNLSFALPMFSVEPPALIDTPPEIDDLDPNEIEPSFFEGNAGTYDMSGHVFDDGVSTLVYAITNSLSAGLSFNTATGVLTYDGFGASSIKSHTLQVSDAVGADESVSFDILIEAQVTISQIPDIFLLIGETHDMSQYINDPSNIRDSTIVDGLSGFATYNPGTELLTGVSEGTETGLTMRVADAGEVL